jgi:DNA adenine methylase
MVYMGGKNQIAEELLQIMLQGRTGPYVEPFAGGMNVICKVTGEPRIASDINPYLIAMWEEVLKGWVPSFIEEEEYYHIRENKDQYPKWLVGWAGFGCSFQTKFLDSYAGKEWYPSGSRRNYQEQRWKNIEPQIEPMKGVILKCSDYRDLEIPDHSIIYCDPPYQYTEQYSFKINYDEFWSWVRTQVSKGHKVYISEIYAPSDFRCIWERQFNPTMGNKRNITHTEKLFICKSQMLS